MWPVTPRFNAELIKPVFTVAIKAEVLDDNNNPVYGGTFHDSKSPFIQPYLTDGSVDVDISRATRRTFQMTLINQDGAFSPGADWTGLFYVNRHIRLWRGLDFGGTVEWVPIGTFMIDHADVEVSQNMSVAVLSGSDFFKKLSKSMFTSAVTYPAGEALNNIIGAWLSQAGVTPSSGASLDLLLNRPPAGRNISTTLNYTRGQYRGEELMTLLNAMGIEGYFDPLGTFVTRDFTDPTQFPRVWTYASGGTMLMSATASFNDDALYNHALVVATGGSAVYTAELSDTSPTSPTSIAKIGDRVFKYESSLLSTQAEANTAVVKVFYDNILLSEDISADVICHPGLEGGDIVHIYEPNQSKLDLDVRVTAFNIPLASTLQTIKAQRTVKLT